MGARSYKIKLPTRPHCTIGCSPALLHPHWPSLCLRHTKSDTFERHMIFPHSERLFLLNYTGLAPSSNSFISLNAPPHVSIRPPYLNYLYFSYLLLVYLCIACLSSRMDRDTEPCLPYSGILSSLTTVEDIVFK